MHCTNCGAELSDGATFCTNCGVQVQTAAAAETAVTPKKRFPLWKWIVIAAAVVVTAGLVVGGILLFGGRTAGAGAVLRDSSMLRALTMADDTVSFVTMDGDVVKMPEPYDGNSYGVSLNGKTGFLISDDSTLFVCDRDGRERVAKDVLQAALSCDGKYLLYAVGDDDDCTLMRYTVASEKETELYSVKDGTVTMFAVSPNGMTVLFTVVEDGDAEMFLSRNGKKPESFGRDMVPVAVADGARYVYYAEEKDNAYTLYVSHGGKAVRLGRTDSLGAQTELNADLSELIYQLEDGSDSTTYLSVRGERGIKIADTSAYVSLPGEVCWVRCASAAEKPYINAFPSFVGRLFCDGDDNLVYLTPDLETVTIAEDVDGFRFSDNGRELIYLDDQKLFHIPDMSDPDAENVFDDVTIDGYASTADLDHIFLLLDDDGLYYAPLYGEPSLIVSDLSSATISSYEPECYVLAEDGKLYYYHAGQECERITGIRGEIVRLTGYGLTTYCTVRSEDDSSEYDMYILDGDKKPELLIEGINLY